MTIAAGIKQLLDFNHTFYRVYNHPKAETLDEAQNFLGFPKEKFLQAVLLFDSIGYVLAVFPLDRKIDFYKLKKHTHRNLRVLPGFKVNRIFKDCEAGSYPPFGYPYGLHVIIDESIDKSNYIYVASGCHSSVIEISVDDFLFLNTGATKCDFLGLKRSARSSLSLKRELYKDGVGILKQQNFPNLPNIAKKVLAIANSGDKKLAELTDLLLDDEFLGKQILNYAKSDNLQHAVAKVLGFDRVSHVAIVMAASRAFKPLDSSNNEFLIDFWRHALYGAIIAEKIAKKIDKPREIVPSNAYLAALFHNFGLLLFASMYPPEFRLLRKWIRLNPKSSAADLEEKLLGMGSALQSMKGGHQCLGALLLNDWGFSEFVCTVAREHHNLNYAGEHKEYIHIIQVTNALLRKHGIGDGEISRNIDKVIADIGIAIEELNQIVDDVLTSSKSIEDVAKSLTK